MGSIKWIFGAGAAASVAAFGGVTLIDAPQAPDALPPAPPSMVGRAPVRAPNALEVRLVGASEKGAAIEEGIEAIRFCMPRLGPLSERCMTRAEVLSRADQPSDGVGPGGPKRLARVKMVHPTDFAEPERQVATCTVFANLKSKGWSPLTSADRVDETRFLRYCGLMSVARLAKVARTSIFTPEGLTADELAKVPGGDWPIFGERLGEDAPIVAADPDYPAVWKVDTPTLVMRLWDVAHADFDEDGEGERLVFIAARARGGSAGFAGFNLLDAEGDIIRLRPIKWQQAG